MRTSEQAVLNPAVSDAAIGDETLLLNGDTGQLVLLNPVAAALWYGLNAGVTPSDIAALISDQSDVPNTTILADIEDVLGQWDSFGILQIARAKDRPEAVQATSDEMPQFSDRPSPTRSAEDILFAGDFGVGDVQFSLRVESPEVLAAAAKVFDHLRIDAPETYRFTLSLERQQERWILFCNGEYEDHCTETRQLAPMLHANTLLLVYRFSDMEVALHAAAVAVNGRCIILPAKTGSGKSTLSAALLAEGFRFCSDDLVLLAGPDMRVIPASFCIGLKQGSWEIAATRAPAVANLETHERVDGKLIRYLPPSPASRIVDRHERLPTSYLVFPLFDPSAPNEFSPLTSAEALVRLTESGYDVGSRLNRPILDRLIAWIENIPSYQVRYNDIDFAVEFIVSLDTDTSA